MPRSASPASSPEDLRLVIDTIPAMAWIVLPDGRVDFMNRRWLEYSGLSMQEAIANPTGTMHPSELPAIMEDWQRHFASGTAYEGEMRLRRADGQYRWFLVRTVPLRDERGNIVKWFGTSTDIEDRVRAEAALRKSERLLRESNELGHTGGWEHDLVTGEVVNTHENLRLFFGDDTGKGERFDDFAAAIHPDDRDYVMRRHALLLENGGPRDIEYRVVWPNGEVHVIHGRATVVRDESGKPLRVYGTNLDVTERRKAEETIRANAGQLQALTRRLVELQEAERRELARELHDRVGQMLTAMRIDMEIVLERPTLRNDAAARARVEDTLYLIQSAFDAVRDVMYEMRPPLLDEYGLIAPLKWYARRFADRTGIDVDVAGEDGWRCDPEVELALFRIAQEGLTNVARHSKATSAAITLSLGVREAKLTIEDNGVGIRRRSVTERPGYGLISMRERAESVRGTFEAGPRPGGGTRLTISVPASCKLPGESTDYSG